ncbi:GDSL-type esterase/lipase family protein [Chryseobacterium sp. SSA4.19]|uniref:GDSL-type esterase/lipase family protein n=1 Tax=Chryseobacterium sp. SSA4.19 TaxID=2919915 RepID=UPI001F4E1F4F|nr:GDSL-type esterase/lipase family protein [Chryseobacterium sp. SSA4.19]MCJ8153455.1 GDSL-type esterase/lipase family protein [Chryseobacterium sp. SSA4.19]
MGRNLGIILLLFSAGMQAQEIENAETLQPFTEKLTQNKVSQILFMGDSHIQADWLTSYLRKKFQDEYGNAGRGMVFPYNVANTNGSDDFTSISNRTWETFRLVHEQKIFPQIGASGFVIGNRENSFVEISFKNPQDSFDKVIIYHDAKMNGKEITLYREQQPLKNFVQKRTENLNHRALAGETFHEIVSKYNSTTTKLKQMNGNRILHPAEGENFRVERNYLIYNADFENYIGPLAQQKLTGFKTEISVKEPQNVFLMRSDASSSDANVFYGFQFLKKAEKGVVFNTVGVNGATYADFLKYPLQIQQLVTMNPDILIIALGTNEAFAPIDKEEFQSAVTDVITKFRAQNAQLPVLLISPPDNLPKQSRVPEIVSWIRESAAQNRAAFFNLYEASGGKGSFKKAQIKKEANSDGVHFVKPGYENQAELIWKAFSKLLNK